jgi:hypothetical protein
MNRRGLFYTQALANLANLSSVNDVESQAGSQRALGRYVRRTSSLASTSHGSASSSPKPLKRSLSDSLLLSPKQRETQTDDTMRTRLGTLPYKSEIPILYTLNALRDSMRDADDSTHRRIITSHVLDSALAILEDDEDS